MTSRRPGRVAIAIILIGVCIGVSRAEAQQKKDEPFPRFEDTWTWFRLAAQHHPGRVDTPLKTLAEWPIGRIHRVRHDLRLIQRLLVNAANGEGSASAPAVRSGPFRAEALRLYLADLEPLLGLPPDALGPKPDPRLVAQPSGIARRAIAVVMAKGVALQTDLMMAAVSDLDLTRAATNSSTSATRIIDGERFSIWSSAVYWDVARFAMDHVVITPRGGTLARDWYYATSEFLLKRREYDAGLPHVAHARVSLPDDGRLAFYAGVMFENLASPSVQVAIAENPATAGIDEKSVLLLRSQDALKTALELDPNLDEAALRLARVLQMTGRQDDAATLLQRVEKTLDRPELRYCAALFLGRADEARGNDANARAAFGRARDLFPEAQSPHLALAAMSWRAADGATATSEVRALPDTDELQRSFDPWWIYDVLPADNLFHRLATVRVSLDAFLK